MVNDEDTKVRVSGDGSTDYVDFSFAYLQDSDIKVYKIDTSVTPEVATLQVLNTDYTVTAGNPQGGKITFTTAPTVDEDAFVKLDAPYTQAVDIPSAGVFREESIENGLDKTVLLCQQLREEISRAIQLPETSSIASVSFDTPVDGRALKWRDDGSGNWTAESSASDPDDAATYADAAADSAAAAAESANAAASSASDAQTAKNAAEAAQAAAEAAAAQFTKASQAEAEAGTDNDKYMTSLRVAQAISEQAATKAYVEERDKYIESIQALSVSWSAAAWVDVDVSAYVPSGTKRVLLYVESNDSVTSQFLTFRKNGGSQNYGTVRQHVANLPEVAQIIVPVDSSRIFEAYSQAGSVTRRDVTLLGYWI